mgnify:CR=1 FL=1
MSARDALDALVVGGGRFGTALATVLARLDRRVEVWVRRGEQSVEINGRHCNARYLPDFDLPKNLVATTDLASGVRRARIVLMAVPSQSFREVARSVGDYIAGDQLLVHATKGFEVASFKRMSQILWEETCSLKIGALSGPSLAHDMMAGYPAGALLASRYDEVVVKTQELFENGPFRVYAGRDVVGTEVAGAFRNVVALATGISDGLGLGDSAKSLLVTRGLNEMARLGVAMGGHVLTFGGLAGVGDLLSACCSSKSLNYQVGKRLASGEPLEAVLDSMAGVAEAVPTAEAVHRHATATGLDLPIVKAVHSLVCEGCSIKQAVTELLSTPVGWELAALREG